MSEVAAAPAGENPSTTEATTEVKSEESSAKAAPALKKAPPSYRKYKIGDQEVSLSDEDIARDYSKWKGADAKFREASQATKSVENFMKALAEDPESVLSDPRLTLDRRKLATKWLEKQIQDELTPPDPRDAKLTAAEQKLKDYEERDAKAKEVKEADERTTNLKASMQKIGDVLKEAGQMTQLSSHPESEAALIREMALYMRAAREQGENPTAQEIVEHIHNSRFQQFYTLAQQFEGEELLSFLGDEIASRVGKAHVARLKAKRENGQGVTQTHRAEPGAPTKRRETMDPLSAARHAAKVLGVKR
jgi:hypothetical protein